MAQKITLKVASKKQVTDNVYFVTFTLVSPPSIVFRAGQNMMLMIPPTSAEATAGKPGVNRTMSIASPPSETQSLLMVHDVSPMGPGSKWTLGLNVGDIATIVAPTGGVLSFIDSPRKKVMIATGTGIAPFHSMILDYFESSSSPITHNSSLHLYWGQRYEKDIYWKDEFDQLQSRYPKFLWHQILSRPTDAWHGLRGHVTEHVMTQEKDMQASDFYLCGSKAMVEEVREQLLAQHVPKEQIKTELFY